jgi:cbb3-type cytochrome oxidase subunit 3
VNPLIEEARNTVQMGWLLGTMTVVFLAVFVGWFIWAYDPGRKEEMDKAARMPFNDGEDE